MKSVIFTSNFSGVHIPVIETMIRDGIEVSGIIFESKISKPISILEKIKIILERWGDLRLIPLYLEYSKNRRNLIKPRLELSKEARINSSIHFNEFNNLEDLNKKHLP